MQNAIWHMILITCVATCWSCSGAAANDSLRRPEAWFNGEEARSIATNILSYQTEMGGWPKNISTTDAPFSGDPASLQPTYDNGATTDELRFLARMFNATGEERFRQSFTRGLDYVLDGQYLNGGWPQFHPPGRNYHRHITFNDNAMVRLMEFVREVASDDAYSFVDRAQRARAADAFDRGIACILQCQVRVNGKLTAWCAQHDEHDFQPRPARSFEPVSLSGSESVGIVRLLMSLENPSPEVVQSVEAAVAWLRSAQLSGIRVETVLDPNAPDGTDKVVVEDPSAPPLWARFYDIDTSEPIFADRDGSRHSSLAGLGYERRNGYAWYGNWPRRLLTRDYPDWKQRLAERSGP